MAASTVARSRASFLSTILLLSTMAVTQSVAPTNLTIPSSETDPNLILQLPNAGPIPQMKSYNVIPLTPQEGKGATAAQVAGMDISGPLKLTDATNANLLNSTDVALISCDPAPGNLDASDIVGTAGMVKPKAILLYSITAQSCNLSGQYSYNAIFSMTSLLDSQALMGTVQIFPSQTQTSDINVSISPNQTATGQPGSATNTSNDGGPAPTTAVAMSILYSITGIITLLFLIIIATGAVRAHRHPERYGPRNAFPGRPRQSRARGLARAMLETLPIVKFGDPEPAKHGNAEVELEDGRSHTSDRGVTAKANTTESTEATGAVESGLGEAQAGSVHSAQEASGTAAGTAAAGVAAPEEHLGCSICTEDFTTGEDVRVLPCNHKFHPACIDPWLLNVSGTCPLCRHDLRPVTSATGNTENSEPSSPTGPPAPVTEGSDLPPPLLVAEGSEQSADPHRNRISRFLDLNRLRHAPPDERIAALRQLREQSQREGAPEVVEDTEERSRRARLTGRLRDTFRIRTRTQNST